MSFKVGDKVKCSSKLSLQTHIGIVTDINSSMWTGYPIYVQFDDHYLSFTEDGRQFSDEPQVLFLIEEEPLKVDDQRSLIVNTTEKPFIFQVGDFITGMGFDRVEIVHHDLKSINPFCLKVKLNSHGDNIWITKEGKVWTFSDGPTFTLIERPKKKVKKTMYMRLTNGDIQRGEVANKALHYEMPTSKDGIQIVSFEVEVEE